MWMVARLNMLQKNSKLVPKSGFKPLQTLAKHLVSAYTLTSPTGLARVISIDEAKISNDIDQPVQISGTTS